MDTYEERQEIESTEGGMADRSVKYIMCLGV